MMLNSDGETDTDMETITTTNVPASTTTLTTSVLAQGQWINTPLPTTLVHRGIIAAPLNLASECVPTSLRQSSMIQHRIV